MLHCIPSHLHHLAPYQAGKPIDELSRELNIPADKIIKLASNENPLGISPLAREAIEKNLHELSRYPDGFMLKTALAKYFDLPESHFVLGNGSNDVLELIARLFLTPQSSVIYSQYAFAVYALLAKATGARGIEVPADNFAHDLAAMLAAIDQDTRLIFIANPNNPTGTLLGEAALRAFLSQVPADIFVVLDEAYTEYLADADRVDSLALLRDFPNLIITRTFSKAFALAGLRVGFAICTPEVADWINRIRQPFNVNHLAMVAAVASLNDRDFVEQTRALNQKVYQQLSAALMDLGLSFIPSFGNFVTFHCKNAQALNQFFLENGMIVRGLTPYAMPNSLRVSLGLEEENARFIELLSRAPQAFL